jgi:hypothetical protein
MHCPICGVPMKETRKGSKVWRCPNNGNDRYDEDKNFRSWWDLSKEEQLHFAHDVRDNKVAGWDELKEAAYKFGFTPDEDMPTVTDLIPDAESKTDLRDIFQFSVSPDDKRQIQGKFLRVSNRCECGCSPYPFVTISDGKVGVTVRFRSNTELQEFKGQVRQLKF